MGLTSSRTPTTQKAMSESGKSGKPELTPEDRKRFREWVMYHMEMGMQSSPVAFARRALEYATIHERSAAQARIAELEKMLEQFTYYGLIHTVNGVVPVDYDSHEDLIKKAKLIFQKQP